MEKHDIETLEALVGYDSDGLFEFDEGENSGVKPAPEPALAPERKSRSKQKRKSESGSRKIALSKELSSEESVKFLQDTNILDPDFLKAPNTRKSLRKREDFDKKCAQSCGEIDELHTIFLTGKNVRKCKLKIEMQAFEEELGTVNLPAPNKRVKLI